WVQGRRHDDDPLRHGRDERPGPFPPRRGCDRPIATTWCEGRLFQAGVPREANRTQGVHRGTRRRHAGDQRLETGGEGAGKNPRQFDRRRQRLDSPNWRFFMATKVKSADSRSLSTDGNGDLQHQYGCGAISFAGTDQALFERHLLFDSVTSERAAGAREKYEAFARSVRDVLAQRWIRT